MTSDTRYRLNPRDLCQFIEDMEIERRTDGSIAEHIKHLLETFDTFNTTGLKININKGTELEPELILGVRIFPKHVRC